MAVHGPITQGELLMGLGIEARLSQLVGAAGINISSQNSTHTRARSFLRKADAKLYQAKLRMMARCQDKLRTARCQDKLRPMHSFRRGGDGAWSLCYRRRDPAGRLKDALLYGPVRKTPLFARHLYIKRSFYQDRLGTNIGKTHKRVAFFAGYSKPLVRFRLLLSFEL